MFYTFLFFSQPMAISSSFLILLLFFRVASPTTFSFNGFHDSHAFIFRHSSYIQDGKLSLTRKGTPSDIGRALYPAPVRFEANGPNISSFSTTFIFSITPGPEGVAQGMAFLVSPNPDPVEASSRGYLGLFNKSTDRNPSSRTFAVELDTYRTPEFLDMDENHVGIDANGIVSAVAASPAYLTRPTFLNSNDGFLVNLKSGQPNQIWIEYDGNQNQLNVSISYSPHGKPPYPFLPVSSLNLSAVLKDSMYIGFSASSANLTDISVFVHAWSFSNEGPLPEITLPASQSNGHKTQIAISVCSSLAAIICILLTIGIIVRKRCWSRKEEDNMPILSMEEISIKHNMQIFTYKELNRATQGFSEKSLLGRGGFGAVHRGTLPDGTIIAVKLASKDSQQGVKEFAAEVSIIGRLCHRNLLPLLGWCPNPKRLALVYEHMPNGSLDTCLFKEGQKKSSPILMWETRSKILQGVAAALVYLHEEWEEKILHRDVKASNVLLDGEFNARLGDFGLARLSKHNTVTTASTNVVGTFGYLAPEYVFTRRATEKVDVYSFGALLLEVITGKRIGSDHSENIPMADYLWQLHRNKCLSQAIDSRLLECGNCDCDMATEVLRLGLLCLHPEPSIRPTMRRVLQVLTKDAPLPPMPASRPPLIEIFSHFSVSPSQITVGTLMRTSTVEDSDSQQLCR